MTIYLIHGLLESSLGQYAPQIRHWRPRKVVVPLQLPGHGDNSVDAGPELISDSVKMLGAAIKRHGPGHVIAASYLGSPVAVRYAQGDGSGLLSLVLMGLVPDLPREVFEPWVKGFYLLAGENPRLSEVYERVHGPRWKSTLDAFEGIVRCAYEDDLAVKWKSLEELGVLTLIANGSHKSSEQRAARRAQELGGMLRGHVFEGAGHVPSVDRPMEFVRAVETHWANCKR